MTTASTVLTPSRLALARKRRRLTLTRLAEVSGISRITLSGYENSRATPGPEGLATLADALGVRPEFLVGSDLEEIPEGAVSFRAKSKLTVAQKDAARGAGRYALLLNEWIEDHFQLPTPDVPTLTNHDPEQAAEIVRARWGLGRAAIPNVVHLLEAHGVRVFTLAEDCADVDAYSLYWYGTPIVVLNTGKSGERGRFDAAHELGHLVLHGEQATPHGPSSENEANRFAAAFLMPEADVLSRGLQHATAQRILRDKQRWTVSAMALTHRLHELQLLTDWEYRSVCVHLSRRGYRRGEPDSAATGETSQLLQKVFKAVREQGSLKDIADHISLDWEELNRHVFGLVPLGLAGGRTERSTPLEDDRPKLELVTSN
ncbi:Zn-dependent peptidase ImmA (M78 family) [Halopolyspora algeriensis]|uniref:Zn-dependent peptidase ImmA (M78 family) n=2 Tax=Halopolyspora algeriensis TaxID=1500506 RepID=A0A368W138_9ACTN|nr:Zn-dependent peptidase ImmA (M78 family) [Halopolyspora algeriensis]TQM48025.1 Zn-dependent peptidase ImmA (M78 family) [Halopolyspora algeriensis]